MTACTSIGSRAGVGWRAANLACSTHVAEAMITWPVFLSTAMTDHVAQAGD